MGIGDWLMATSQVRRMYAAKPIPVFVVGIGGRLVWSEVFDHNPKIIRGPGPTRRVQRLQNGGGVRPYIAGKTAARWLWKPWDIAPGELFLTDAERAFGAVGSGLIMIEPNVKTNAHANKAWPFDRWQRLVDEFGPSRFVQCGPESARWLAGVHRVVTPTFRHACAVMATSRAFVGTEGGLHHAAAALGVPAVVLFSEFIAPKFTGYASHRNIRHADEACGSRTPCASCIASMDAITVDEVGQQLTEVLQ